MADNSRIEWTESTWNPVTGCTKISSGCRNCYAERMAKRLKAMGIKNYVNGFKLTTHPDSLNIPLKWKKPRIVFVNSMSDLFHEEVPFKFIEQVFGVMNEASSHIFQILTKRSLRLLELNQFITWPSNVWMGVTVEDAPYIDRIDHLRATGAVIKFLSIEPLLGPLPDLNLSGIDWVIVGGESGPGARPMKKSWVLSIRDNCCDNGIPFFFKQWGGVRKSKLGRLLEGRYWNEMPTHETFLQVAESAL